MTLLVSEQNSYPTVVYVDNPKDYALHVVYDNGVNVLLDLTNAVNECSVFNVLRDKRKFKAVKTDGSSVFWPNYDIDLCANAIYDATPVSQYLVSTERWVSSIDAVNDNTYSTQILFRATSEQKYRLERSAQSAGMSVSQFLRRLIDNLDVE